MSSERSRAAGLSAKHVVCVLMGLSVLAGDQLGKRHAEATLEVGERVPILGSLLALVREPTQGGALGLFRDWSPEAALAGYALLSLGAVGIAFAFLRALAPRELGTAAALGAVLGGVVSNGLDRARAGASLDFLHLGPTTSQFLPEFNLADLAITLGVGALIIELLATEMAARAAERPRRMPPH